MGGQRGLVVRGWRAGTAAVLLLAALSACSSGDDGSGEARTERADRVAQKVTPSPADVAESSEPSALTLPAWLPTTLPVPEKASVVAVREQACSVTFMDWGSDAQLEGATLGERAEANGLRADLVSSVSQEDPVVPPVEGDFSEEVDAAPVVSQVVVLRMRGAAATGQDAVDATLTLTSHGAGSVTGEYALVPGTC